MGGPAKSMHARRPKLPMTRFRAAAYSDPPATPDPAETRSMPRPKFVPAALMALAAASTASAQVDQILAYKPSQPVDVDTPAGDDKAKCKVETVKVGKGSGYVLTAGNGLTLRRFDDTTGDGQLDRYRYYKDGLEVYRDVDTDADKKVDQFRWLNTAGGRHGEDRDGDGRVDRWLRISAEEASAEAVRAIAAGDARAMAALLFTAADAKALGVTPEVARTVVTPPGEIAAAMKKAAAAMGQGATWQRFDATPAMPALVPAESGKAARDTAVYANGIISVDKAGKPDFLIAGEVVQVGEAWKLTGVPVPNDGESFPVSGFLQPAMPGGGDAVPGGGFTPEQQKLIDAIAGLDVPEPDAPKKDFVAFNTRRARLLKELIAVSDGELKENTTAELIDAIAAGVQGDAFPGGLDELAGLAKALDGPLGQRAQYRLINVGYVQSMRETDPEEQPKLIDGYLRQLEGYAKKYPRSEDTPDALYQLGSGYEMSGDVKKAQQWYTAAAGASSGAPSVAYAKGALKRLNLKGRPLELAGPTMDGKQLNLAAYEGNVVAVVYWASNSQMSNDLVEPLKKMQAAYGRNGFRVVGVNLDLDAEQAKAFAQDNKLPWPNVQTQGGLTSPQASGLGLVSASHVILVDKDGRVADESASLQELQREVPKLLLK